MTPYPKAGPGHAAVREYLRVKHRRPDAPPGLAAIEGVWMLGHALDASVTVRTVFVCLALVRGEDTHAALARAASGGADVFEVAERVLDRMVDRDGSDGTAAVVVFPSPALDSVTIEADSRLLVLDGVEIAGNLGTTVRCADATGTTAVMLTRRRARPDHPSAIKASMGCVFSTPVVDAELERTIRWLGDHRVRIVAADPAAATSYRDADYSRPVAVVLGSERYGLADEWRATADELVAIPMFGVADSLNIANAAALLSYEALHRG